MPNDNNNEHNIRTRVNVPRISEKRERMKNRPIWYKACVQAKERILGFSFSFYFNLQEWMLSKFQLTEINQYTYMNWSGGRDGSKTEEKKVQLTVIIGYMCVCNQISRKIFRKIRDFLWSCSIIAGEARKIKIETNSNTSRKKKHTKNPAKEIWRKFFMYIHRFENMGIFVPEACVQYIECATRIEFSGTTFVYCVLCGSGVILLWEIFFSGLSHRFSFCSLCDFVFCIRSVCVCVCTKEG